MEDYVVLLRHEEGGSQGRREANANALGFKRRQIYDTNLARTVAFQRKLQDWLTASGLESEVTGLAEPSGFPVITLTATPKVARQIQRFSEVESVTRDSDESFRFGLPRRADEKR